MRTTLIVGFPGETEDEFAQLLEFVQEVRLERVGVFTYSDEDGTPAMRLPDKVPVEAAEARMERLMLAQQEVAFSWNTQRLGTETDLLIDGVCRGDDGSDRTYGRSYAEAPEIDSRVFLTENSSARVAPTNTTPV